MVSSRLEEVKGDKSKIHFVYGNFQISFFVVSATAANTLLKEKVFQEKDGISSRKSLQEFVQNSASPFLRPWSTRSDVGVGFPDSYLTARMSPGN